MVSEHASAQGPGADVMSAVVGHSKAMQEVVTMIRQVAASSDTTVLLQGESGTGKDVVARTIHALSSRAAHQFVDLNCAAIPETLLETELFGVESGAFTDAGPGREGYLVRANKGTLFLDEIGSMPLMVQPKILRFLETRTFRPVGSTKEIRVDLRIISATNLNLKAAVAHRTFREDLFYRLEVFTISLPPLRERLEDIEPLVTHFLQMNVAEGTAPLRMSAEAMTLLARYPWPGNVRELRSVIQYAQVLCDGGEVLPAHLPQHVLKAGCSGTERLHEVRQQMSLPAEGIDLAAFLSDIERKFIQEALNRCHGNQVQAAALLGMSRDQMRYHLKKLRRPR
ncbi:MAG: sigma-54-dependent Fis family transcriptional regulator [Ktedonobacteraceae bacterium]|nr:sigma-54-dependent Fis family transcriptional regulator [Ktedonobacteraceae bacterium]